jgi:hypothetical protein
MGLIQWLENAAQSVGLFFKKEVAKIPGDAAAVVSTIEGTTTLANNLVNSLKTWVESPQGQSILSVINAVPGIGPYVGVVLNVLPTLLVDLGHVQAEFTKSPEQIVEDGLTKLVKANTPAVKATNLIALQAHLNTELSAAAQTPISIQAAVSIAPTVYDGIPSTTSGLQQSPALSGQVVTVTNDDEPAS